MRHLSRLIPLGLEYESLDNVHEIDSVLDTCYCLVNSKTKTERARLILVLSKNLGKAQWLCGCPKFTIADVAASSAIKQVAASECNQTLTKWLQRCENIIL